MGLPTALSGVRSRKEVFEVVEPIDEFRTRITLGVTDDFFLKAFELRELSGKTDLNIRAVLELALDLSLFVMKKPPLRG